VAVNRPFAAAGSLAGYLWQLRGALLTLFDAEGSTFIEIETHDDVLVRAGDGVVETCVQYKHSFTLGTLTVASEEWWKAIRVWLHLTTTNRTSPSTGFVFCTTLNVDAGLACLADGGTPTEEAILALCDAMDMQARGGRAAALERAHEAWNATDRASRCGLLRRVRVLDAEPALRQIHEHLDERIHAFGVARDRVPLFRQRLVGWFDPLVEERLENAGCRITRAEFTDVLIEIHEDMSPRVLSSTMADAPTPTLAEERQKDPTYLRQLDLLNANEATLEHSVAMVERARKQRDEYMQTRIVGRVELVRYDDDLVNEWRRVTLRELRTTPSDEPAAEASGWRIFDGCMEVRGSLRGQVPPLHVANGSFHLLADQPADDPRVGWHPAYRERLASRRTHG